MTAKPSNPKPSARPVAKRPPAPPAEPPGKQKVLYTEGQPLVGFYAIKVDTYKTVEHVHAKSIMDAILKWQEGSPGRTTLSIIEVKKVELRVRL